MMARSGFVVGAPIPTGQPTSPPAVRQVSGRVSSPGADLATDWPALSTKFKIVRVDLNPPLPTTTVLCSLTGHATDRSFQVTARVTCSWRVGEGDHALSLAGVALESYEDVFSQCPTGTLFREHTPSVMAAVAAYPEQLVYSCDDWAQQVEARLGANFMGYQGVSVGDVNGDLLEDVYLCQTGGIPNLLLVQQPDGTLRDVSAAAGVDLLDSCRAALFIDIDNDGDQDLVISSITGTLFFENDGSGQFTFRQRFQQGRLGYSLAAADYDQDGDLDVYVCLYHPPREAEIGNPLPYYDANNGSPNVLLANDGDWQFHDATSEAGLQQHNQRWSYAASWGDYDGDGDADLYVANDFGRNCLYRNDSGQFTDVAQEAGVEDVASGMSVCWGDYNRDGFLDLYVSNMFSSAGGRVTYQRQFKSDVDEETRGDLQRLARGNSLFENQGNGTFRDVTMSAMVEMGRWAWSSNFVDLNNDGWEDIVVANGNYTGTDTGDL